MRAIKDICDELNLSEWRAKAERAYNHGITPEIAHSIIEHYLELCTALQESCQNLECRLESEDPDVLRLD